MKTRSKYIENEAGYPIVLTASRAEMSNYDNNPFLAFLCTFPKHITKPLLRKYLSPVENEDGSAKFALYGLRKVESLLVEEFGEDAVVVSNYDSLHKFIGKETKLVCISTMDPMALAFVSTTYNSLIGFGGEATNTSEFKRLVAHPSLTKYRPKVLVGGAGAWQIRDTNTQDEFGIDVLFQGEAERDLIDVVKRLLNGEEVPRYYKATKPKQEEVPLIKHASCYGMVEIMRGCGRGCQFCSPTMRTRYSFPLEHIMKEVEININGGSNSIFTVTEDMFLYKSKPGFIPRREKIVELYHTIASYPGVEHIILSHASFAPIIYDPKILEELTPILIEKTIYTPELSPNYKQPFITVEVGIETGSARLMNKTMKGKALPYSVDNWPELVVQGIGLMNDHDWRPLCTIMAGQPDETEDDVIATLNLVDDLRAHNAKMFYTPVLFVPFEEAILGTANKASLERLSELQWEFISKSWKNNIDVWYPEKGRIFNPLTFSAHWCWFRWRHGKKATIPMMHLAGLSDSSLPIKVIKKCDTAYCQSGLGDTMASVKEKVLGNGK
ncbi:MAG: B12-binding domain-containing radical SAM protein [Thermoplasmata archaeon]|nr:B12-binding domain-containing radical SAM protein [Thermoplasmata archaeon]